MSNYVVSSVTQKIVNQHLTLSKVIAKENFLTLLGIYHIK
jgi:hypothetical protein